LEYEWGNGIKQKWGIKLWDQIQKEKELPFSKQIKFFKKNVFNTYTNFSILAKKKKRRVKKQRKKRKKKGGTSLGELGKLSISKNSYS